MKNYMGTFRTKNAPVLLVITAFMRGGYETTGNYDAFCGIIARWNFGLDKLEELDAKERALRQSIVQLHKVAEEKKKKGIYITEEFYQAEKIYKEKVQFNKTKVKPLEDELKAMWEDFKAGRKGK